MKQHPTLNAPAHLRPETKAWWLHVHANWRLEQHHTRLLTMAGEAWDRAGEAREILAKDGILLGGREGGSRPHPAIAIERDSRIAFARLIAQLSLDGEATGGPEYQGGHAVDEARRMEGIKWSSVSAVSREQASIFLTR